MKQAKKKVLHTFWAAPKLTEIKGETFEYKAHHITKYFC